MIRAIRRACPSGIPQDRDVGVVLHPLCLPVVKLTLTAFGNTFPANATHHDTFCFITGPINSHFLLIMTEMLEHFPNPHNQWMGLFFSELATNEHPHAHTSPLPYCTCRSQSPTLGIQTSAVVSLLSEILTKYPKLISCNKKQV